MTQINTVNKTSEVKIESNNVKVNEAPIVQENNIEIQKDSVNIPEKEIVSEDPFKKNASPSVKKDTTITPTVEKNYPRIEVDMQGLIDFEERDLSPEEEIKKYKSEPGQPKIVFDANGLELGDNIILYANGKKIVVPKDPSKPSEKPSLPKDVALKPQKPVSNPTPVVQKPETPTTPNPTPVPRDLTSIVTTTYSDIRGNKIKVRGDVVQPLNKLMEITNKKGIRVAATYGYRSNQEQQRLWNNAIKKYGSAAAARKWVAPPGKSRHNKGIALDVTMYKNGRKISQVEFDQIAKQAGFYRPMSWEGWHIEPISTRK